jgi:Fe-S-cluster-containing dehydrogenase component
MSKPRYGMVMDVTKCNGCYNCFLACKDEFCGNDFPPYSLSQPMTGHFWMNVIEKERGRYPRVKVAYTAIPCMHCENATCVKAASEGEIYRRPDGIVIIDPVKSRGHKYLIQSCPYRVIYWNEEKNIPQKCTLCAHLLDAGWKEPRCVEACPTKALVFGNLNDPESEAARLTASGKTEILHPEYDMQEKVSYIGLPKRFIAGTVVFGDSDLCADNVTVSLSGDGQREIVNTNNFGDFEFEGLKADQGYSLEIRHKGYKTKNFNVQTETDVYLGEIILEANSHQAVSNKR